VVAKEAGGITQHIGAYQVSLKGRMITFLDTPGHEAFTAMRARGAKVTDIVILVVAADDGVMPQTREAVNHAKAAGVPIIVAINKIDKPDSKPDRVKQELSDLELAPEEWGGQTIFCEVSAKKKIGLEHLLEMILIQADVLELNANPDKMARGTIIEAKLDKGRGPVATVLVQSGTLRQGDIFVSGTMFGRVRALNNDKGDRVEAAGPAVPVEVIGFSGVPSAGERFIVLDEERKARALAEFRTAKQRNAEMAAMKKVTLEDLHSQIQEGTVKELNIVLKADVQGSAGAIVDALGKLSTPAV
jgi:translation initiation factor IF-2